MLKAQIDKSIASAWETNAGVPAKKRKKEHRQQFNWATSLLTEPTDMLSRNILYKQTFISFLIISIIRDNQESHIRSHTIYCL